MRKFITIIFVQLGQYVGFASFYLSIFPISERLPLGERPWWHYAIAVIYTIATIYVFYCEVAEYIDMRTREFTSVKKINEYMKSWISKGSRVAIFSRDLSWAQQDEPEIQKILLRKARQKELYVFVENETEFTDTLKSAGAEIRIYGPLQHVPRSRFTIIDFEQAGARVAIGQKRNNKHVIQEFQEGSHPCFSVAEDLVKVLMAYNKQHA